MNSNIMIRVEGVSKKYRIGKMGSGRLREDLRNWWLRSSGADERERADQIWALRDVSFDVEKGEVLGIIGNNGAGKSTLLKIISHIVAPTSGCIMGNGRIASLLEVGTGFHAELTGRENIFLNGSILGMKKKEIENRFDAIVDFSGIEQFINTPVKRYSSGMYTRLAFAVAAHLDPEILIVDEVLAVGDADFQRKCIGKMKEVSSTEGKTVLFVSHNMTALQNLCDRAIALHKGQVIHSGDPATVIGDYLRKEKQLNFEIDFPDASTAPGNEFIRIQRVALEAIFLPDQQVIDIRTPLRVKFAHCRRTPV
jgi:lipopolysaccharide transport system ATP-binding protein